MNSTSYEGYHHYAPAGYTVYISSQALSASSGSPADPYRYPPYENQTQTQPQNSEYQYPLRTDSFPQYPTHIDSTQTYYGEPHTVNVSTSSEPRAYPERASVSFGSSAYPASAVRTTNIPLYSPHPEPAASAPLLSASYVPSTASHYSPREHHIPVSGFDGLRRMSVPEMHGQHYDTGYVQSSSFHLDASRRMSVPNLYHQSEASSSYSASTIRPSPSYPNQSATSEPFLAHGSPGDESSSPTSSSAGFKAQLAPQGSGADLMEYYANLDREAFQTPCQLLDSLLKAGSSASGHSQVDPVPVESAREEKKQTETSRQARLRYMSESVGFQPTDPDTLSCHEKKRNYIECLENYVGWLRAQCELVNLDAGDIERTQSYKGLSTRSVRTMIVHMQKELRTDHSDTLREEGEFLHLRERVMAQEAEQADAASRARRGF